MVLSLAANKEQTSWMYLEPVIWLIKGHSDYPWSLHSSLHHSPLCTVLLDNLVLNEQLSLLYQQQSNERKKYQAVIGHNRNISSIITVMSSSLKNQT